jgi:hypothetical protein
MAGPEPPGPPGPQTPGFVPGTLGSPKGGAFETNGAKRARTADLLGAIQALSQLSYSPVKDRNLSAAARRVHAEYAVVS